MVRDTAKFLGTGIGNLLNILNPDVVVITGGVTHAGEPLFEPLRAEVRRRAFRPAVDACRIVAGTSAQQRRNGRRGRYVQAATPRSGLR